jgi:hypothetical protein
MNFAFKKGASFIGSDADTITSLAAELQEIVMPAEARARDRKCQRKYDKAMRVWAAWEKVWRLLNDKLDSRSESARAERADQVQAAADEFLDAWVEAVGNTQGLFIIHEHCKTR